MDTTIRLFWLLELRGDLPGVYQHLGTERLAQDYEDMVAFYEEVHNALRTIWRRRRVKWLEPLAPFLDEDEDAIPDTERQPTP